MKLIGPNTVGVRELNSTKTSFQQCSKPIDVSQDLLHPLKLFYSNIIDASSSGILLIVSVYYSRHVQSRVKFQTIIMLGVPLFSGTGITFGSQNQPPTSRNMSIDAWRGTNPSQLNGWVLQVLLASYMPHIWGGFIGMGWTFGHAISVCYKIFLGKSSTKVPHLAVCATKKHVSTRVLLYLETCERC